MRFETAAVRRGDLKSSITTTGTLEALNTVEVGAEISGQIQTINVDFNDTVTKGQLLVELDPQQQQAAAEQDRYNLGAAIFVQVREAEEAVREADLRTIRARVDLAQAEIALDHLTGKTLEKYAQLARPMPKVSD